MKLLLAFLLVARRENTDAYPFQQWQLALDIAKGEGLFRRSLHFLELRKSGLQIQLVSEKATPETVRTTGWDLKGKILEALQMAF